MLTMHGAEHGHRRRRAAERHRQHEHRHAGLTSAMVASVISRSCCSGATVQSMVEKTGRSQSEPPATASKISHERRRRAPARAPRPARACVRFASEMASISRPAVSGSQVAGRDGRPGVVDLRQRVEEAHDVGAATRPSPPRARRSRRRACRWRCRRCRRSATRRRRRRRAAGRARRGAPARGHVARQRSTSSQRQLGGEARRGRRRRPPPPAGRSPPACCSRCRPPRARAPSARGRTRAPRRSGTWTSAAPPPTSRRAGASAAQAGPGGDDAVDVPLRVLRERRSARAPPAAHGRGRRPRPRADVPSVSSNVPRWNTAGRQTSLAGVRARAPAPQEVAADADLERCRP